MAIGLTKESIVLILLTQQKQITKSKRLRKSLNEAKSLYEESIIHFRIDHYVVGYM